MQFDLAGKKAIVTGGSRGMGFEWAKLLLSDKVNIVLVGQNKESLLKAQKELEILSPHQTIEILEFDLKDEKSFTPKFEKFLERTPIDILINNAGVVHRGRFTEISMEQHREVMEVNILGMMSLTHMVLKGMVDRKCGYVVNIASMAGLAGVSNMVSYVASKWAVIGFTESLRLEMQEISGSDIKFMTFCPSYVKTGMFHGAKPPLFSRWLKPRDTVRKAYEGFKRGKTLVIDPDIGLLIPIARSLLPTVLNDKVGQILGLNHSAI